MPTINIFSTKTPYAMLSNNFRHDIIINGSKYPTATNYIYSNMLNQPTYKVVISKARPKSTCIGDDGCNNYARSKAECEEANCVYKFESIGDQFNELYEKETNDRKKDAIEVALMAKLEQTPSLLEKLLGTGNRPIIYASRGKWMGIGEYNDGENNYGKILEATRNKLIRGRKKEIQTKNQSIRDENLYQVYLAYSNLVRLIKDGDDLQDYFSLPAGEIIDIMKKKGVEIFPGPGKKFIIQEAKKTNYGARSSSILVPDIFIIMKNPKVLSAMVRGKYLASQREKILKTTIPSLILKMYCGYLLKKSNKYDLDPDDYDRAIRQQIDSISPQKRVKTSLDLKKLYEKGMLSESLSKEIDNAITELKTPRSKDIKKAEQLAARIRENAKKEKAESEPVLDGSVGSSNVIVWGNNPDPEYNFKGLSPLDDSVMINIEGKNYPSITYYCIAEELASCCTGTRKSRRGQSSKDIAYKMLKNKDGHFLRLNELEWKLNHLNTEFYIEKLKKNTQIALKKKFENRSFQDALLSTKDDTLVWGDRRDPILGMDNNFVGRELMLLRARIRKEREKSGDMGDVGDVLSLEVLSNVFKNDFLNRWFNMRVRDMCSVVLTMKDYMYLKHGIKKVLTPEFVTTVIDDVYQPCSHIFATEDKITIPAPMAFIQMVERYKGFLNFFKDSDREKVLDIMWRRLAVTIYYLMKHIETSTSSNIAIVLNRIERLTSLPKNCTKLIPDEKENCIFSALLNIVGRIKSLDRTHELEKPGLQDIDLGTAVTILLNINSLAEQQAMQRKRVIQGDIPTTPVPSVTAEDIRKVRAKLPAYEEDVIVKVIEEVEMSGEVPDDNMLRILADAMQNIPGPSKRPTKRPMIKRPMIKRPMIKRPPLPPRPKKQVSSKFVPDPIITENIRKAFSDVDIIIEDDNISFVYMVDAAIEFVKSYKMIPEQTKINRINFFASLRA